MKKGRLKKCGGCAEEKQLREFSNNTTMRDGLQSQCKACNAAYLRAHPRKRRASRDRIKYGLSHEECEAIRALPCSICGAPGPSSIDHCHTTGKVRGPLCMHCNTGLGKFRDSPTTLQRAIDYLLGEKDGPDQDTAR